MLMTDVAQGAQAEQTLNNAYTLGQQQIQQNAASIEQTQQNVQAQKLQIANEQATAEAMAQLNLQQTATSTTGKGFSPQDQMAALNASVEMRQKWAMSVSPYNPSLAETMLKANDQAREQMVRLKEQQQKRDDTTRSFFERELPNIQTEKDLNRFKQWYYQLSPEERDLYGIGPGQDEAVNKLKMDNLKSATAAVATTAAKAKTQLDILKETEVERKDRATEQWRNTDTLMKSRWHAAVQNGNPFKAMQLATSLQRSETAQITLLQKELSEKVDDYDSHGNKNNSYHKLKTKAEREAASAEYGDQIDELEQSIKDRDAWIKDNDPTGSSGNVKDTAGATANAKTAAKEVPAAPPAKPGAKKPLAQITPTDQEALTWLHEPGNRYNPAYAGVKKRLQDSYEGVK